MSTCSPARLLAIGVAVAIAVAAPIAAAGAPTQTGLAATQTITPNGVGGVKLGAAYSRLRGQGLVGKIQRGCELGGPRTRSALLRPPLDGSVDFTLTSPRKVTNISIRGGALARGVGIGATLGRVRAAYPRATIDHSTERVFGTTLVKVPKNGGGRLQFAVHVKTKKVALIGIPFVAFCE